MTTPSWSRRSVLSAAGAALAALTVGVADARPALAADAYDALRLKWRELLLGTGFTASDPLYAGRLTELGAKAVSYRSSMAPSGSSLWPDLPYASFSGDPVSSTYNRLKTMALAHAQPGTGLTGDASLAADIVAGLQHVHDGVYNASFTLPSSNWWWNAQIGAPTALLDTCVLMYDSLSAAQTAAYCAAVDHFVPDSQLDVGAPHGESANRVDFCKVVALRGVVGKSSAKIARARDGLSPVFPYVTSGDGFYRDGSFIQHSHTPYTGSYGAVLLSGLAWLFALLGGSSWDITDPGKQLMLDSVERSFAPFVYNGLLMDAVSGRAVSRGLSAGSTNGFVGGDHGRAQGVMAAVLMLAMGASAAERTRWRGMVKGWLQRDYFLTLENNPSLDVASLSRLKAARDDAALAAVAEPVGHRVFGSMDRATHRRPNWAASLSMSSSRVAFYAFGNLENKRGWHTGSGMLSWWKDTTLGQFTDTFWPTVDPYRLPGTTVSKKTLADGAGGDFGAPRPTSTWAGGASDGTYAALGMDIRGLQSTLGGRKSWFFLDDAVVCLGAGIGCTDGTGVESIVENRNLGAGGTHTLTVDGVAMPATQGWSATLTGARWASLAGMGGYVFPGGATVKALRQERTGAWSDINGLSGSTTPFTRRYLTLWFDHGTNPTGAGYSYLLMPGADSAATAARAADSGWMSVLANTANQQGVHVPSLGFTGVNFYGSGTVGTLTSTGAASVMVRVSGTTATVCVANPTQTLSSLDITWNRAVSGVVSQDPSVTVLSTGPSLRLRVDTTAKAGASQRITVTLG
ncbi:polysaccharide lyase 8 family protein [Streptomyces sp. NPDC026092]|uniref:polysaccharide lyase 8 family protein n=1 Tax=Streptomyces sp. NPDC026092 TaxID=3154797 RepID=UPI0033DFF201